MILFAVLILLSRPVLGGGERALMLSPALFSASAVGLFYLVLDRPLGLLMCAILAVMVQGGQYIAAMADTTWAASGIGLFVVGWIIQGVGHVWEGKKPAFFDDLVGLIIGPLFVTTEIVFLCGARQELQHAIEARVGKIRARADS